MNLHKETRRLLRKYEVTPKKRLSQNFLVDSRVLRKLVSYADLGGEETVLEIGAGLGFLTERLAEAAGHVVIVEVDPGLVRILRHRLSILGNLTILEGDIRKIEAPRFDKCVSTPPYSLSSPILFWLLARRFKKAALAFQEEFADRLGAAVGSEDYGRLTVTTCYHAHVEMLDHVPKEAFFPSPKVDSRIVRLTPRKAPFRVVDETVFFGVVRTVFTQKNKKLRNAVMPFFRSIGMSKGGAVKVADGLPFRDKRPRELAAEEIGLVADRIAEIFGEKKISLRQLGS